MSSAISLVPILNKINEEKKYVFLLGDFNADLMNTEEDIYISNYFDTLTTHLFVPHIIYPTRVTPNSKTLIDNIFSNSLNYTQGISGNITSTISDHFAQFLIIPRDVNFEPGKNLQYKRNTRNFDRENFILDLLNIDWPKIINIQEEDVNKSFNVLETNLNNLIEKYMPMRKLTKKEVKSLGKPWITNDIKQAIRQREKMYGKFIKAKDAGIKEDYHRQFKELRNQIVNRCRISKNTYYRQYFTEYSNNIKNTWKGIKTLININSTVKDHPTSLLTKKGLISQPKEIANTFNVYFSTIAKELQGKIYHRGHDFNLYLKNKNEHNFFINPTNRYEVLNIINTISISKAIGPHSIPTDIFHLIKLNISVPLTEIINLSFNTGVFIENLKTSKVIPIYKNKGSDLICNNYRPISLLSNVNKIIEKLMHIRLYNFLSKHNCIYESQFGFREKYSTNHALLALTEEVRKALDDNLLAVGVFIDLQKAFDTVDHHILLNKLDHYGVRGVANRWFKSYLMNRKQFVTINGSNSNLENMQFGVPQGSVLGPLLFLIYINDLHTAITYSVTRHFADDTNLLIINKSPKQLKKRLNIDLHKLAKWLKANKISLNASKTEMLIFRHPNKKINYELKIKLDGKKIFPSKYVKYLGILIDEHLNWSSHSNFLASKLSRANGMLSKIRHYVNNNTLRTIYFGIFESILNYGSQIWGQNQNNNIQRLIKLQDRALRIINYADYFESSEKLYKSSNILKLEDNINLLNFMYVYDSLKGILPKVISQNFTAFKDVHHHNTRGSSQIQLKLPKVNTVTNGIRSINYQSAYVWNLLQNKIPDKKLHSSSRNLCKKIIRNFYVDNYLF